MAILYDFECTGCANVFEELVSKDKLTAPCPECGSAAARLISAPRIDPKLGVSRDFPTMADKWERRVRAHHKGIKSEEWD